MSISPQSVSAVLRRSGMLPVPRHSRDGVSVSKTHNANIVHVVASIAGNSLDDPAAHRQATRLIEDAVSVLTEAGYSINREDIHLYVTKP